jgi:hypothetical protein
MEKIISVEGPISDTIFDRKFWKVGINGVNKIDVIERKGEMAPIEMLRIHFEDGNIVEIRRTACVVSYKLLEGE